MKGKFRDRLVLPVFFGAILMLLHSNCVKKISSQSCIMCSGVALELNPGG